MYFDEGCIVVNEDLAIPAHLSYEFSILRALPTYQKDETHRREYIKCGVSITPKNAVDYAQRMKSWDLGRVVGNFDANDALHFLESHPKLFKTLDSERNVRHDENTLFSLVIPEGIDPEKYVYNVIDELTSHVNYSKRVLRTVGLLYDTKEEVVSVEDTVSQANYQLEASSKMLHKVKKEY